METVQTYRALYNFEAQEDDELDLQAGDLIDVYVIHEGDRCLLSLNEHAHTNSTSCVFAIG